MAQRNMSEFVNTYTHYEGMPLLGGNLLEFLELDSTPTTLNSTTPAVNIDCGLQNQGLLPGEEIEIDQDLKVLEGLLDFHGDSAAGQSTYNNIKPVDYKPYSPSSGSDSGLSSPGSAWGDRFSPSPDILTLDQAYEPSSSNAAFNGEQYHLFENALPELSGIDMTNAFGSTADFSYQAPPQQAVHIDQPVVKTEAPETEALLEELGIQLEEQPPPVQPTPPEAAIFEVPAFDNIQLIEVPQASNIIQLNFVENYEPPTKVVALNSNAPVVDCVSESTKPKSGRKRKITSAEERKERKREQNKTAATRYRERKRSEMLKRDEQLNALKAKNTSLKDEKNRVHREIDYLRELLVEVYKLKGVI